jgi:hypothetical protein
MRILKIFVIIIATLPIHLQLYGQLVNTESSRKERKEGIQASISLAFNLAQTTTQLTQFQNSASLQYTKQRHTYLLLNSVEFLRLSSDNAKQDLANQNFQHFRYNYNFRDTAAVIWEYFLQHQQNKIKYQDLRIVTGTGPRVRVVENKRVSLFICPLVMYEHELEFETATTKVATHVLKGDLYGVLVCKLTDEILFRHVTYYQPALFDFTKTTGFEPINDFRVASESALVFKLFKKRLEFATLFNYSHDSRPPGLFFLETQKSKMTFFEIKNEIKVNF